MQRVRLSRRYRIAGPLRTDRGGNAQIPLPLDVDANSGGTVVLEGTTPMENYNPNQPNGGAVLVSTLTGQTLGSNGVPSVIGGPTRQNNANAFSFIAVGLKNFAVEVPHGPTIAGADLRLVGRCDVDGWIGIAQVEPVVGGDFIDPGSQPWTFALRLPEGGNYNKVRVRSGGGYGFYAGLVANTEHSVVDYWSSKWCRLGVGITGDGGAHAALLGKISTEWCHTHIGGYTESIGRDQLSSPAWVNMQLWDIEDGDPTKWWATDRHLYDPASRLRGAWNYFRLDGVDGVTGALLTTDAGGVRLNDLSAPRGYIGIQQRVSLFGRPAASVDTGGAWVWTPDPGDDSGPFGASVYHNNPSAGVEISFAVPDLPVGTYDLQWFSTTTAFGGAYDVLIDGDVVGSIDAYSASTTHVRRSLTVALTTGGDHLLTFRVTGKNASSSNFYVYLRGEAVFTRVN